MNDGPVARAAALAALGHRHGLTSDQAAHAEQARADDPDPRVRAAALGALVRAGDPSVASGALLAAVSDAEPAVRRRAAELAPALERAAATAGAIVGLLDDLEVTVVEAAAWALGELGDDAIGAGAVPALAHVVDTHPDPIAREAAVAALGALGDAAGVPAVLVGCTDRLTVRRRAVLALAPFSGPDVDAALARALGDKDWQVRQAAEDLS